MTGFSGSYPIGYGSLKAQKRLHERIPNALALGLVVLLAACAPVPQIERGPESHAIPIGDSAFLDREVQSELSGQPGVSGVRLVQQNPLALAYRLQTARVAERSLDAQYYIWHDDFTGRLLASELGRAADRGVRVRVLVDDLDLRERHKFLAAVDRHPNLEVRVFNPFYSSPGSTLGLVGELLHRGGRLNHRMHNKAWIADNRVAIVGGRNVGDEYFGASEQVNFSDTGLVMGGPVVAQVSREFDEYWNSDVVVPVHALLPSSEQPAETGVESREAFSSLEAPRESTYAAALNDPDKLAEFLARRPPPLKVSNALVVADAPSKVESKEPGVTASRVLDAVLKVMNEAKSEILIVSPYFVPGESGASSLAAAEQRGVRVAVLTNSLAATDVLGVHAGYAGYRKVLLHNGVELFELKHNAGDEIGRKRISWKGSSRASLHTKAVVVDDRWVFVGSMNFDQRSAHINTEMGVLVESPELAAQLHAQFDLHAKPEMSYAVTLDEHNGLVWHDRVDGREREHHTDPDTTTGRRFMASFLRVLPLESQL
jgi:putative cardiolipin synthase